MRNVTLLWSSVLQFCVLSVMKSILQTDLLLLSFIAIFSEMRKI